MGSESSLMVLGVNFFGFIRLGFGRLFGSVGLSLLPNLWNFQELFLWVFFQSWLFLLSFWDSGNMNIRYFVIVSQLCEACVCVCVWQDMVVGVAHYFITVVQTRQFPLICLWIRWLFPMLSPMSLYCELFILVIVFYSSIFSRIFFSKIFYFFMFQEHS